MAALKKQDHDIQQSWVFHRTVLKSIYSGNLDDLRLLSVRGDSMDPVLSDGDYLLVNIADTTPSPPGIFVLHDGLGIMAKRIELIPEAAPGQIRISPANTQYFAYQRHLDDIRIIGRVVWYGRSLCH
ncbi:MAG: S24 family peptidase [Candidatus Puniceispirillaceae bacterium]